MQAEKASLTRVDQGHNGRTVHKRALCLMAARARSGGAQVARRNRSFIPDEEPPCPDPLRTAAQVHVDAHGGEGYTTLHAPRRARGFRLHERARPAELLQEATCRKRVPEQPTPRPKGRDFSRALPERRDLGGLPLAGDVVSASDDSPSFAVASIRGGQ